MVVCSYNRFNIVAGFNAVLVQDENAVGNAVGELALLGMKVCKGAYSAGLGVVGKHIALVDIIAGGVTGDLTVSEGENAVKLVNAGSRNA